MTGGMDMKAVRVLCLAVICLLMALPVNSVGYQTSLFVSPIPSLSWGMRREEIVERFELNQKPIQDDIDFLWLTAEQLGWDPADYLGLGLRGSGSDTQGVQVSFIVGDSAPSEIGVNRLYEIRFNVSVPDTQTAIHRFVRLYGEPVELEWNGENLSARWFCYPYEESITQEEKEIIQRDSSLISRSDLYPRLYVHCTPMRDGEVLCEVSYYAGMINFPADFFLWFKC